MSEELSDDDRAWIEADERLLARANVLAAKFGRDRDDLYRTLKHLARTPSERLRLGLLHGRLHPQYRGAEISP